MRWEWSQSGGNNICGLNDTEDDAAAHVMEDVTSLVTGDNNPGPPGLIISRFLLTSTIRHLQIHQLQISADIRYTTNHSTLSLIFTGWYWSLFSSERLDMSLRRFVTVLKQILNLLYCLDWTELYSWTSEEIEFAGSWLLGKTNGRRITDYQSDDNNDNNDGIDDNIATGLSWAWVTKM